MFLALGPAACFVDLSGRPGCGSPAITPGAVRGQSDSTGLGVALQRLCFSPSLPACPAGPLVASPGISRLSFPRLSPLPATTPLGPLIFSGACADLSPAEESLPCFPWSLHCPWHVCRTVSPASSSILWNTCWALCYAFSTHGLLSVLTTVLLGRCCCCPPRWTRRLRPRMSLLVSLVPGAPQKLHICLLSK